MNRLFAPILALAGLAFAQGALPNPAVPAPETAAPAPVATPDVVPIPAPPVAVPAVPTVPAPVAVPVPVAAPAPDTATTDSTVAPAPDSTTTPAAPAPVAVPVPVAAPALDTATTDSTVAPAPDSTTTPAVAAPDTATTDSTVAPAAPVVPAPTPKPVVAPVPKPEPAPAPVAAPVAAPEPAPEPAPAPAPAGPAGPKWFGFRLGLGISDLAGNKPVLVHGINRYAVDFGPSFSVEGGVAFQFDIAGDWLSIAPELHYQWFRANGKGDKSDGKGKDAYEAGVSAHQVELPVLLRFNFQGLALELGPEFAYTIASTSTQKLTYSDSPENNFKSEDDTYKLNGFGFGVVAGVGYTVLPGLLIDARYSYGFLEHAQDNGHPWTLSLGAVFLVL